MGHAAGSKFKAQMDLGTLVLYISPPLDSCLATRKNQGIQKALTFEKVYRWKLGRFQKPINALLKGVLSQAVWFSCHHYLTVRESRQRACQLALASVKFLR